MARLVNPSRLNLDIHFWATIRHAPRRRLCLKAAAVTSMIPWDERVTNCAGQVESGLGLSVKNGNLVKWQCVSGLEVHRRLMAAVTLPLQNIFCSCGLPGLSHVYMSTCVRLFDTSITRLSIRLACMYDMFMSRLLRSAIKVILIDDGWEGGGRRWRWKKKGKNNPLDWINVLINNSACSSKMGAKRHCLPQKHSGRGSAAPWWCRRWFILSLLWTIGPSKLLQVGRRPSLIPNSGVYRGDSGRWWVEQAWAPPLTLASLSDTWHSSSLLSSPTCELLH